LVESRIPVSTAMGTVSRRLDSFSQNNPWKFNFTNPYN
jgi:hypothetical protein